MIDHSTLPVVATAKLPTAYVHAKEALEKCERLDECKEWADKAAALASYAKQADDDTLFKTAMKIKGRAIRRAGELLKQIDTAPGRPPKNGQNHGAASVVSQTRETIHKATGFSPDQQLQAIRVASIPKREFEKAIEAEKPPTLTVLAKQGTKPRTDHLKGRDPAEFNASINARGALRRMTEMCESVTPRVVVRGANAYDLAPMRAQAKTIAGWIARLQKELEK